jgi:hypothetical protein
MDARGRQRSNRVSEAGSGMQYHQRWLVTSDRVASRDADDRALVQTEHQLEVNG